MSSKNHKNHGKRSPEHLNQKWLQMLLKASDVTLVCHHCVKMKGMKPSVKSAAQQLALQYIHSVTVLNWLLWQEHIFAMQHAIMRKLVIQMQWSWSIGNVKLKNCGAAPQVVAVWSNWMRSLSLVWHRFWLKENMQNGKVRASWGNTINSH